MDYVLEPLPAVIFGLKHHEHRIVTLIAFLSSTKASFHKRSRKTTLLSHVAAQERTLFASDQREQVSGWFRRTTRSTAISKIIYPILGDTRFKRRFVCSVCMARFPGYFFPQGKLAPDCDHDSSVCIGCLGQSLDREIGEKPWDQVACPECPARLDFDTVKLFATAASFLRYERKSALAAFEEIPYFMTCLGPDCHSGQIHEGGDDQPIMTCTTCKYKSCFTHKVAWHSDLTCDQYDEQQAERTREEAATQKYLAKKTKVCPNIKCGLNLDKYTGCDHVTCTRCHHEFCWRCSAPYNEIRLRGNDAHEQNCKWHTSQIGVDHGI